MGLTPLLSRYCVTALVRKQQEIAWHLRRLAGGTLMQFSCLTGEQLS